MIRIPKNDEVMQELVDSFTKGLKIPSVMKESPRLKQFVKGKCGKALLTPLGSRYDHLASQDSIH
jgi:hypothetical protein